MYGTRRYRVLVALGEFCLRLYNVYFFCFIAFFSIALWWHLLSEQWGLPLPKYVELGVGVVMFPLACLTVLGNWYLLGLKKTGLNRRLPFGRVSPE